MPQRPFPRWGWTEIDFRPSTPQNGVEEAVSARVVVPSTLPLHDVAVGLLQQEDIHFRAKLAEVGVLGGTAIPGQSE